MNGENVALSGFAEQLVRLNATMAKLFDTGDVSLFTEMNAEIKEMYRLQHDSKDRAMQMIGAECKVIYGNFDMIVAVLRTTENGEIDEGAQRALNKLLHNIDVAVIRVAEMLGLVDAR